MIIALSRKIQGDLYICIWLGKSGEKDDRSVGIVAGEALAISFEIGNLEKFSIQDVTHIQGITGPDNEVDEIDFIADEIYVLDVVMDDVEEGGGGYEVVDDYDMDCFKASWSYHKSVHLEFPKQLAFSDAHGITLGLFPIIGKKPEYCREDKLNTSASLTHSSLEDDKVSKKVTRLASVHCWHSLSFGLFQAMHVLEVSSHKELSLVIGDYVVVRKFNKICQFHK
ncbi:hypothetical protein L1987_27836 [Smallanthus sonchifolius]|uniref:Uncharacterized protein n=1 Tax=Smallanthus sonchifolius TaxID=185202 RepID=A0ACB9IBJ3_9ASTR|nr:hypothetical protein L1987_27836 [Smallanthus sonchifolius]